MKKIIIVFVVISSFLFLVKHFQTSISSTLVTNIVEINEVIDDTINNKNKDINTRKYLSDNEEDKKDEGEDKMGLTEIISLVLGAVIGVCSSLVTTLITRFFDKKGKLNIFYKFVSCRQGEDIHGFKDCINGRQLILPIKFEIQNTSNTNKVVRDLGVYIYKDKNNIAKFIQAEYYTIIDDYGNETKVTYGSDNGSYTFNVKATSIICIECEFSILSEEKLYGSNNIKVGYYDEKNKFVEYQLINYNNFIDLKIDIMNEYEQLK